MLLDFLYRARTRWSRYWRNRRGARRIVGRGGITALFGTCWSRLRHRLRDALFSLVDLGLRAARSWILERRHWHVYGGRRVDRSSRTRGRAKEKSRHRHYKQHPKSKAGFHSNTTCISPTECHRPTKPRRILSGKGPIIFVRRAVLRGMPDKSCRRDAEFVRQPPHQNSLPATSRRTFFTSSGRLRQCDRPVGYRQRSDLLKGFGRDADENVDGRGVAPVGFGRFESVHSATNMPRGGRPYTGYRAIGVMPSDQSCAAHDQRGAPHGQPCLTRRPPSAWFPVAPAIGRVSYSGALDRPQTISRLTLNFNAASDNRTAVLPQAPHKAFKSI